MIQVLGAEQVRDADAFTIGHEPVTSLELMERAAQACVKWMVEREQAFPAAAPSGYLILCGMGNNGGDGLAIARLLASSGRHVRVCIARHAEKGSPDFEANLERLKEQGVPASMIDSVDMFPEIAADEWCVDALFGTGLRRPITGWLADLVRKFNASGRRIIAIDLPSGLFAEDNSQNDPRSIVQASHTLSFQVPKPAFFFRENAPFVGEWSVLPIGLSPEYLDKLRSMFQMVEAADVRSMLKPRERFSHKGDHGHALIIAGGKGKLGAAIMAVRACLRSGVGLVTAHVPGAAATVIHGTASEAMCSLDADPDHITTLPPLDACSAIGVGPGLGITEAGTAVLKALLQQTLVPLVIDADALNVLSANPTWLAFLPKGTILTPHPGEFDRLAGKSANGHDRLQRARDMAVKWRAHIVLKGAWTAIIDPEGRVTFNATGNPGMAKGGSGDALTGLITGLLAQGHRSWQASVIATYVHGLAGDLAAAELGMDGMIVNDLIEHVPAAWKALRQ